MKIFAACLTAFLIAAPGVALATYMCDKRFAEIHGSNCPVGTHWDSSYHGCVAN